MADRLMRSSAFSAKAEYACVAMLELAVRYGQEQPVRLKDVAEAHRIPQRFLVQILLQLKAGGLVVSTRGAAGGYQLSRPPAKISLADVISVVDCMDSSSPENTDGGSVMVQAVRGVWRQVQTAQHRILAETSLTDLLDRAHSQESPSYQI